MSFIRNKKIENKSHQNEKELSKTKRVINGFHSFYISSLSKSIFVHQKSKNHLNNCIVIHENKKECNSHKKLESSVNSDKEANPSRD